MTVFNVPTFKGLSLHSFFGNRSPMSQCYTLTHYSVASFPNYLLFELIQTITSFAYKKRHSKLQGDSYSFTRGGGKKKTSTKKLV